MTAAADQPDGTVKATRPGVEADARPIRLVMPNNEVIFGWGAPPVKQQHPVLPDDVAAHFDKDNEALIRLSLRGYLTDGQKRAAMAKITRRIGKEIQHALSEAGSPKP